MLARLPALLFAATLGACGGGSGGSASPPQVRSANTVYQGSTNFDVLLNGQTSATNLGYGQASALQAASGSSATVVFEPTGTTTHTFSTTFGIADGSNETVLATGSTSSVSPLVVAQANGAVAGGSARLSFVHADSAQAALDWYVSAPTAALPGSATFSALSYPGTPANSAVQASTLTLASGDWRLRAVASGETTRTVIYDSGPISLASSSDLLLAVVQASGSAAPVTLFGLDAASQVHWLPDQRSLVRFGQFAIGYGSLDAFLDTPGTANGSATLAGSSLALGSVTSYAANLPSSLRVSFAASGQTAELFGSGFSLPASVARSLLAVGVSGQTGSAAPGVLVTPDDLSAPAPGSARLRLVHVAPDLAAVDGVILDTSGANPVITQRWVPNLAYPGASAYVSVAPGTYTIAVVPTGVDTPLLPASAGQSVTVAAGGTVTVFLAGCRYPGTGVCGVGSQGLSLNAVSD